MLTVTITANGKTLEDLSFIIERAKNKIAIGERELNEQNKDSGFFFEVVGK